MAKTIKTLIVPILLLWLFVVIAFYYWGHQYTLIPAVIGLIRIGWHLFILSLLGLSAFGLGLALTRLFRLEFIDWSERVIFSIGLGAAALGLLGLAVNSLGLIQPSVFWLLTLAIVLPTLFWLFRRHQFLANHDRQSRLPLHKLDYFFLAFIGLVLFIGLQLALAPPIAWDGLSTHLVLAKLALSAGQIEPSQFTNQPIAGHLLFIWGMALGGESLPQLLSYAQGLLMVAAVFVFTRQHFDRRTAILAAALLCSVEVFIITAAWPYLDVPMGLFGLLSVLALANWQLSRPRARAWLALATIFAVTAAATKLNGLFIYPTLVAGLGLGFYWRRADWRRLVVDLLFALACGLLLALLWLAVETALRPAPGSIFNSAADAAADLTGDLATAPDLPARLGNYLTTIWEMTIIGQQGGLNYDGTISPFFLIFIPLLLLLPGKPRIIWALLLASGVEYLAWLFVPRGYYQNRHLILTYPLFSILSAYFVSRLAEYDFKRFSISGFVRILLVLVLFLQLIFFAGWLRSINPTSYLLGLASRAEYLAHNLNGGTSPGYYDMIQVMNERLPADSIVAVPWPEPRTFYCQMECLRYTFPRAANAEQMAEIARDLGLTHVLISRQGLEYWLGFFETNPGQQDIVARYASALTELADRYGRLVHAQDDSYYLYQLQLE